MMIKNILALAGSLFFFGTTVFSVDNSIYKNIPPCTLCAEDDSKLLTPDKLDDEITKMESWNTPQNDEFNSIADNEDTESESNGSWNVDTKTSYKRLKIRYKGTLDVTFKRLLLVKTIANQFNKCPDFSINLKRMILYLYTPSVKGLTKKDFETAYALKKIISDNKIHTVYSPAFVPTQTRLSLDSIRTLVAQNIPQWSLALAGGRNISRTFSFDSFSHAFVFIFLLGNMQGLAPQLREIALTDNSVKVNLQSQSQKTVHTETINLAASINTVYSNL